ncbi:MAG: carbohydrate binding family 9 domain-containing protein [Bacteroidia bacterium]|nr:carbohydrate binding family 9 domain-containing protein [Bacteroidia bacterium]
MRTALTLLIGFFCIYLSSAQDLEFGYEKSSAKAYAIENAPVIDGNIKDDPAWQNVEAIGLFYQQQPNYGLPASEKTDFMIAYDTRNLYIAAVCYDADPQNLVVADARRDASLSGTDAILFIMDTYQDGQNGFVFGTNPAGIEYDAQIDNEGVGNFNNNRQQGGMIGGVNINWDASWTVKTAVTDEGWVAEFAIPLKTIRFSSGEQVWGFNVQRNIPRSNEVNFWSRMPVNFDLNRVSMAGEISGLNLNRQGNLKLIPYVLGQTSRDYNTQDDFDTKGDAGIDLKYSLTPALTLDLTYNTDFAQVEVDDQQVNLDRFNLFFPEKRPFFLENAGQFAVGSPGEIDLFFSRRIGIGENGRLVPIIGGARLSGKLNQTNVGFLSMFTDEVDDAGILKNSFTVARVNHEFQGTRSALGAAFINRGGVDRPENAIDDFNRTYALDGQIGFGKKADLSGFVATTKTAGVDQDNHAFQLIGRYTWNGWRMFAGYSEVSEGFNPEVGFLGRTAFKKFEGLIFYTDRRPENSAWLEWRPHVSYRAYWNFEGFQETGFLHVDNHWVFKSLFEFHTGINFTREGVTQAFEISEGVTVPTGTYDHEEAQIVFITNPNKPLSISTRHVIGGFFGGRRSAHSGSVKGRIGDKFNSELGFSYNDIDLPEGDFIAEIYRLRLSYSFTPRFFVQSLIQYNSSRDLWSTNARLGWIQQANTGLFIVFNDVNENGLVQNRSFTVKYSRLFDVLK